MTFKLAHTGNSGQNLRDVVLAYVEERPKQEFFASVGAVL